MRLLQYVKNLLRLSGEWDEVVGEGTVQLITFLAAREAQSAGREGTGGGGKG